MIVSKIPGIEAIAFDIDGTLYPAWKLTLRAVPFFIRHIRFMKAFGKVRHILHGYSSSDPDKVLPDFFNVQNELLATHLNISPQEVSDFLDREIYKGWKKKFVRIRPYPFAKEAIIRLKEAGFKIGIPYGAFFHSAMLHWTPKRSALLNLHEFRFLNLPKL